MLSTWLGVTTAVVCIQLLDMIHRLLKLGAGLIVARLPPKWLDEIFEGVPHDSARHCVRENRGT